MGELSSLIITLSSKKNQFGPLGHLVLKIAIKYYKELAESKNLSRLFEIVESHQKYADDSLPLEKIIEELSFLDKFILRGIKQLNYKIDWIDNLFL